MRQSTLGGAGASHGAHLLPSPTNSGSQAVLTTGFLYQRGSDGQTQTPFSPCLPRTVRSALVWTPGYRENAHLPKLGSEPSK